MTEKQIPPGTRLNNGAWMTFDEIVNDVEFSLTLADKKTIANFPKSKMISLHGTLGMWIRNTYGLWVANPLTLGWIDGTTPKKIVNGTDYSDNHPDAVSFKIIEALWDRLSYLRP